MKNIIIYGSSRSGKTQLAKYLSLKLHYNIVMLDSLVSAFQNSMPHLEINHSNRDGKSINNLEPFLMAYLHSLNKIDKKSRNLNFIIEGSYFNFDNVLRLKQNYIVIILLMDLESPEKYYKIIKKYDKKYDWTYNLSDEELYDYSINLYNHNSYLKNKCIQNNIFFYNTATQRPIVFKQIYADIKDSLND